MQVNLRSVLEATLIGIFSVLWCEFAYYYHVFYLYCPSWPGIDAGDNNHQNLTKLLIIADTHIMGPIKSFKIDKWRREWQMKQAFSVSTRIYRPDIVLFMGDLLDEGLTSHDDVFQHSSDQFDEVFESNDNGMQRIIVPGNHDVGFHDRMIYFPFLFQRFRERFMATSSIELIRTTHTKPLNLVVSNSMSLYNDSCSACINSLQALNHLESRLDQIRSNDPNNYSPPIFIGHIPLHRKNDLSCIFPESLRSKASKDNIEGKDVLHDASSRRIISKLHPRLAISGHTHMQCLTTHRDAQNSAGQFDEITVTSYNHKYAELEPGFLLLTVGQTQYYFKHCRLISEIVVLTVYVATLFAIVFRLIRGHRRIAIVSVILESTDSTSFR